jgi:hypothetical protein
VLSSQSFAAWREEETGLGRESRWTISQFLLWTKSAASIECQGLSAQAAETLPPWVDLQWCFLALWLSLPLEGREENFVVSLPTVPCNQGKPKV